MFPQDKEAGVSFLELLTAEAWVQHLNLNLSDNVWNEATRNPQRRKNSEEHRQPKTSRLRYFWMRSCCYSFEFIVYWRSNELLPESWSSGKSEFLLSCSSFHKRNIKTLSLNDNTRPHSNVSTAEDIVPAHCLNPVLVLPYIHLSGPLEGSPRGQHCIDDVALQNVFRPWQEGDFVERGYMLLLKGWKRISA
jgi:hypothetical protein